MSSIFAIFGRRFFAAILCMRLCMCMIRGITALGFMELKAEDSGMSAKAEDLMRQQYLVPRKSVKKLREMSRREGVSAGALARRAIEAYTSGNILAEPEEEVASRAVLKDIHTQVRAALTRIDASLSEILARERAYRWHLPCPGGCRDEGVVRCTPRGSSRDRGALRTAGYRMSLIGEVIKYGKDIVLLGERVDALMSGRKETTARLEDHERRLIRIETLIEISQARRRELPKP